MVKRVTVAVCTFNRSRHLRACVDALAAQTFAVDGFDILIVDNASTDDTSEVAAELAARHANVLYVFAPKQGAGPARNEAMRQTKTPLLAYMDDDQIARPDWLANLVAPFDAVPDLAIAGGEVLPVWETPRPDWLDDSFLKFYSVDLGWSKVARPLADGEWLLEGNICFDVEALRRAGGFDERFGPRGTAFVYGEGFVIEVIRRAGGIAWYVPGAIADHLVHADRMTPDWYAQRVFWQGVTDSVVDDERFRRFGVHTARNEPLRRMLGLDGPRSALDGADFFFQGVGATLIGTLCPVLPLSPNDWRQLAALPTTDRNSLILNVGRYYNLGYLLNRQGIIRF